MNSTLSFSFEASVTLLRIFKSLGKVSLQHQSSCPFLSVSSCSGVLNLEGMFALQPERFVRLRRQHGNLVSQPIVGRLQITRHRSSSKLKQIIPPVRPIVAPTIAHGEHLNQSSNLIIPFTSDRMATYQNTSLELRSVFALQPFCN